MSTGRELLLEIKRLIAARQYRVRIHAVRHMIEEGFDEDNLLEAMAGRSKILENYPDETRCLVLGYFFNSGGIRSPLHVVCDYSNAEVIDIITAYVPQKPWWATPTRRGRVL